MTIQDFGIYSRPVLFENENEDYPYSVLGSCFGVEYENQYFIITAQHVLNNRKEADISIPYVAGSDDFLPLNSLTTITNSNETEDTDKYDIAIIDIEKGILNKDFNQDSFFKIKECFLEPISFEKCIIYGFPQALNEIDYSKEPLADYQKQPTI